MGTIDDWTNDIHTGDAVDTLAELPADSVHMCMTSPPYWNLRDYGHDDQLGLEETATEYVENIADVFDEVKRVLRDDGSLWLNLGDTYDNKDLQQIPARVALELQDRGWTLRNRVTWAKPNPMPQSVKDRLNDTTEAIFHFVKDKQYWYDLDAIREEYSEESKRHIKSNYSRSKDGKWSDSPGNHEYGGLHTPGKQLSDNFHKQGKNPGDVFEIATSGLSDVHFAVYPAELCEKPIKATCPEDGVVLDPFAGAGTTALVAKRHGRRFVGIDLNEEYVAMAQKRLGLTVDHPEHVRDDGQGGFEAWTDGGE